MADPASSIFAGLSALYTADTGSGGLNETSGAALVRHFVRRGDPNFEMNTQHNWPMVIVEVFTSESRQFANRRIESIIRMHLYTDRDANTSSFTTQNAVSSRITALYDGTIMSQASFDATHTITYSELNQLRDFQAPATDKELHLVIEFSLISDITVGA